MLKIGNRGLCYTRKHDEKTPVVKIGSVSNSVQNEK